MIYKVHRYGNVTKLGSSVQKALFFIRKQY